MKYQINKLSRSMKEDLFNQHAMFSNPDANEQSFYLKSVPVKIIDLNEIDDDYLYNMSDAECNSYMQAVKDNPELAFGVVSEGKLIDGVHRITSRLRNNLDTMYVLDMTGLINPDKHMAGHICEIQFTDKPVITDVNKPIARELSF